MEFSAIVSHSTHLTVEIFGSVQGGVSEKHLPEISVLPIDWRNLSIASLHLELKTCDIGYIFRGLRTVDAIWSGIVFNLLRYLKEARSLRWPSSS